MQKILIKLAYWILHKYPTETLPVLIFNGAEYKATSVQYKHRLNKKDVLIVTAERKENV